MKTNREILEAFKSRDIRALSKLISRAEDRETGEFYEILSTLYPESGKAKRVGFTGPPGAGKSSIINRLVQISRDRKQTAAVVAVDPVSPFTGGALLGDRIRLSDHYNDPGVYIRSLSTRGKLGGLSLATREVTHLLDAFGFNRIFIETVGVGQSEVEIRKIVPLTVVVLVPESGDSIQTLKAGILEVGNLFVVNKSDRGGADKLAAELKTMVEFAGKPNTPILQTSLKEESSIDQLFDVIDKTLATEQKKNDSESTLYDLLLAHIEPEIHQWVKQNAASTINPYDFMLKFSKKHPPGTLLPS
jgi:LAO/AO transport system kinase